MVLRWYHYAAVALALLLLARLWVARRIEARARVHAGADVVSTGDP